jgi:protein-serine/threonine kinase
MSQKLGWGPNAGVANAQARLSGDQEMQGMLELLARAKLVGANNIAGFGSTHLTGPLTGSTSGEDAFNIFDASFHTRPASPEEGFGSPRSTAVTMPKTDVHFPPLIEGQPLATDSQEDGLVLPGGLESESSSRTPTNESRTTAKTSPPLTRRESLTRTFTDAAPLTLQDKLVDTLSQPFVAPDSSHDQLASPTTATSSSGLVTSTPHPLGPAVHGHSSRWAPAAQAIFTTESTAPYTILAANDLACLVFGVTKAEVRKMGILEVVREERRAWLVEKLGAPGSSASSDSGRPSPNSPSGSQSQQGSPTTSTNFLLGRATGVTAALLSRPNSRQSQKASPRRAQTDDGVGSSLVARTKATKGGLFHPSNKSRGVLLCGDVVPIQKRNGVTGSASLWVKEKRAGLIWVLEEIHEDVAVLSLDEDAQVTKFSGSTGPIWGEDYARVGMDIGKLIPRIPRQGIDSRTEEIDYAEVAKRKYFTARQFGRVNIPCIVDRVPGGTDLRVSSFPHIAGIMVLSAQDLQITSSNSVFSAALFGQEKPDGRSIMELIPDFDRILKILTEEDAVRLVDGLVIPEHSFRRARAFLALRDGKPDAAAYFLRPDGLPAKHRDGTEIRIDCQLRVVKSDTNPPPVYDKHVIEEISDEENSAHHPPKSEASTELVYALWITYSRHIHAGKHSIGATSPLLSGAQTPLHQPSPGQTEIGTPMEIESDGEPKKDTSHASLLTAQLKAAAKRTAIALTGSKSNHDGAVQTPTLPTEHKEDAPTIIEPEEKKTIDDFVILEEMGQGAYGQVKLARYKKNGNRKVVLKYVTKRRILVDTWTRDRRLGTVPLEIHVLDYLRRDGFKHPNIVEMADFFEDDVNYYIEMVPHGLPGMDLFDYIELRVNMDEHECRSIFVQVARAIHHLHTKALVVHRDIKDENVVLDGEGNIKLIDFGSAAYIKNGPFDVFVGTIGIFIFPTWKFACSNMLQIMRLQKFSLVSPTEAKNKMFGLSAYFSTRSFTKRIPFTASMK